MVTAITATAGPKSGCDCRGRGHAWAVGPLSILCLLETNSEERKVGKTGAWDAEQEEARSEKPARRNTASSATTPQQQAIPTQKLPNCHGGCSDQRAGAFPAGHAQLSTGQNYLLSTRPRGRIQRTIQT